MLAALACAPTWLSLGARWFWLLDLATCFVWWYAAVLPLFLIAACWLRQWRLALVITLTLAINLFQLAPYFPTASLSASAADASEAPYLRVMSLNVLTPNRSYDKVLRLVEQEDPDVIVLLEVNDRWVKAVALLEERYPYHGVRPRSDNFGIAIYSRLATDDISFPTLSNNGTPIAVAQLTWGGQPLTVVGAHPLPPTHASSAPIRNADLAALGRLVSEESGAAIVMGDLNITPFSPYFQDLLNEGDLHDSSAGRGLYATWGSGPIPLIIPIDHVLHTPDLSVKSRRVGPNVGSDHRSVTVDFVASEN